MADLLPGWVGGVLADGKLNDLPVNAGACALYGPARSGHDLIVGDVLVCPSSAID